MVAPGDPWQQPARSVRLAGRCWVNRAFHVQGRLIERHGLMVVRDETRQVDADSRDEAFRIAGVLRDDGFTVWVWAVDDRAVPAALTLIERIVPVRRAGFRRAAKGLGRGAMDRIGAA